MWVTKLAFLVNLGQAMRAYSMPCCGSVGGCGARAVSRKTPIYFIYLKPRPKIKTKTNTWHHQQVSKKISGMRMPEGWIRSVKNSDSIDHYTLEMAMRITVRLTLANTCMFIAKYIDKKFLDIGF